jgi:hypothetical protein
MDIVLRFNSCTPCLVRADPFAQRCEQHVAAMQLHSLRVPEMEQDAVVLPSLVDSKIVSLIANDASADMSLHNLYVTKIGAPYACDLPTAVNSGELFLQLSQSYEKRYCTVLGTLRPKSLSSGQNAGRKILSSVATDLHTALSKVQTAVPSLSSSPWPESQHLTALTLLEAPCTKPQMKVVQSFCLYVVTLLLTHHQYAAFCMIM